MATEFTKRALIIVPASSVGSANLAAQQLDPVGGEQTFTVGLSADGNEPVTHYWCSVAMTVEQFAAVQQLQSSEFPDAVIVEYDLDLEPGRPNQVLQSSGLQRIAEEL